MAVLSECHDLAQRGLVGVPGGYWLGISDVTPGNAVTIGVGGVLVQIMRLGDIPVADREAVVAATRIS
jgi:hypothetical protein